MPNRPPGFTDRALFDEIRLVLGNCQKSRGFFRFLFPLTVSKVEYHEVCQQISAMLDFHSANSKTVQSLQPHSDHKQKALTWRSWDKLDDTITSPKDGIDNINPKN
jgi:hypothetical protein